jgi:hypothetical protein
MHPAEGDRVRNPGRLREEVADPNAWAVRRLGDVLEEWIVEPELSLIHERSR